MDKILVQIPTISLKLEIKDVVFNLYNPIYLYFFEILAIWW